jgi:O-acetylhomoserine/O-acetylserine sulfhydrylase-like pyridoxal-dependent enzyme
LPVGGVIIDNGNFDWRRDPRMAFIASPRQETYRNIGACL